MISDVLRQRIAAQLARKSLQPAWEFLASLASHGMGYSNVLPQFNGKSRFLDRWINLNNRSHKPIIFDVGANKGIFSHYIASRARHCEIHCFEPDPVIFKQLRDRYADDPRIIANELAAKHVDGDFPLYIEASADTRKASFLSSVFSEIRNVPFHPVSVRAVTLDHYCCDKGVAFVDLIKIDVEGDEFNVLGGCQRLIAEKRAGAILFEFNMHGAITGKSFYRTAKLMEGFDIYKILPDGLYPVITANSSWRSVHEVARYMQFVAFPRHTNTTDY